MGSVTDEEEIDEGSQSGEERGSSSKQKRKKHSFDKFWAYVRWSYGW